MRNSTNPTSRPGRLIPVLALTIVLGLGLGLVGSAQTPPTPARIGTLLDYTGALAEFGPAHRNAIELAMAEINAAARLAFGGPIVSLVHEDSATSAAVGVDRGRKLVTIDRVVGIIGSLASGVTVPVAEAVSVPARIPQISPSSTSPLLTALPDRDFLFRTTASDALQGIVAAQLAAGELVEGYRARTASTIFVNNPYGQGLSEAFARAFEARGGRVLAQVPHPVEPQPTYAALLERALAGNPDILVAISYPGHATVFLKESRDLFRFTNWQFVDGTRSVILIRDIGAALEGRLGTAPAPDPESPSFIQFDRLFGERFGARPPIPFMDAAFDAAAIFGLAVAKAMHDGAPITGVAIRDRLRVVANAPGIEVGPGDLRRAVELIRQGQDINYQGAAGMADFDANGDVITAVGIWRYQGGTIQEVTLRRAHQIPTR